MGNNYRCSSWYTFVVELMNRKELEKKVADAKHMSKPDAENAVVLRDATGRWICEIYTAGHTVKVNKDKQVDMLESLKTITEANADFFKNQI